VNQELTDALRDGANGVWSLGLTGHQLTQFSDYADLLREWNGRMNLTRIVEPRDIAVKHFLDSLSVLAAIDITPASRIIDVGTGPGLPGIALKIARPDLDVTLVDSTAKKLTFCRAVIESLQLTGIRAEHGRAEDLSRAPQYAGQFDIAVARAVAPLEKLLPWLAPFVRPGGLVVAMKGAGVGDELVSAGAVSGRLKVKLRAPIGVDLPGAEEPTLRQIVVGMKS